MTTADAQTAALQVRDLDIGIGSRTLVRGLSFAGRPGEFICVLGTNGVGKTLTLHTLAGLRRAPGRIQLCGTALHELSRRQIARRVGLLLQLHDDAFPLTVLETALTGHYPRSAYWQWRDAGQRDAAREALAAVDLAALQSRSITTLSGGERERLALATLLVQDPAVWLLDEPANHLDPQHLLSAFELLRRQTERGRCIVATVHNPVLAARFADAVLLLHGDGRWEFGAAAKLLDATRLEQLYRTPFNRYRSESGRDDVWLPL